MSKRWLPSTLKMVRPLRTVALDTLHLTCTMQRTKATFTNTPSATQQKPTRQLELEQMSSIALQRMAKTRVGLPRLRTEPTRPRTEIIWTVRQTLLRALMCLHRWYL